MKKISRKTRNMIIVMFALIASVIVVTTSWATLSVVDSQHKYSDEVEASDEVGVVDHTTDRKSRAPEPSTVALFGSGILGMVISFVRRTYRLAKRAVDIVLSVIGIIVCVPLFLFAALLVRLTSKGPIIYKQVRVGKDGKLFEIFKFRTMRVDAEKESGPVWAAANDNRLTPAGDFLRKSHMDEIPQFFNVLRGDMSVIGPRPERPVFVNQFKQEISDYEKRLVVKPGITGLAQVWHRYDETIADVRKKIKYDLLYIKKICLWTDLSILFRTVRVVFTGEGAR